MKEQVTISSLEFAQESNEIRGRILAHDLGRLGDVLYSPEGELDYLLQGSINVRGDAVIRMQVQGTLQLVCQRCLGLISYPINTTVQFLIVPNESMLPAPDEDLDDMDYLVADTRLNVLALVEDEILLELPMAPLHEVTACGVISTGVEEKKASPFKVLQGLKFK